MTIADNANGCGHRSAEELVVVHVSDAINPALAGHGNATYQSPPHPRDAAMKLVGLLLGRHGEPDAEEARWTCPIAGGRRTVTLQPAPNGTAPVGDG
jgi:hypothetical protein